MIAPVTVVDAPMGTGKTQWAIQMMRESPEETFLYCTPYLDEVERIVNDTGNFVQPRAGKYRSKLQDINALLASQVNIASSHALFHRLKQYSFDLIDAGQHTLLLDEVVSMIEPYDGVSAKDLSELQKIRVNDRPVIEVDEDGFINWTQEDYEGLEKYDAFKRLALNHMLMFINKRFLMLRYPPELFTHFKQVYVLTYLFEASYLKYFFDLYGIKYEKKSVVLKDGRYELTEYTAPDVSQYKELLHIHMDKYNDNFTCKINTFSSHWFGSEEGEEPEDIETGRSRRKQKQNPYTRETIKQVKKNMRNFFRAEGAKGEDILWTTFKDQERILSGNGYAKSFLSCNARSTNQYKDRWALAYILNKYMFPALKDFFNQKGILIGREEEDLYALSEMLQWIWRSRIREGKPVTIYIPSSRMRKLLIGWLNGK